MAQDRRLARPQGPAQEDPTGELHVFCLVYDAPRSAWRATAGPNPTPSAAAIFIATGPDEFYAAGNSVSVAFSPNRAGARACRNRHGGRGHVHRRPLGSSRQLAGDETGQGQESVLAESSRRSNPGPLRGIQTSPLPGFIAGELAAGNPTAAMNVPSSTVPDSGMLGPGPLGEKATSHCCPRRRTSSGLWPNEIAAAEG